MTKIQFENELRRALSSLPEKEIENSLAFYREMIDDRIESGMSEEDAVGNIGSPADAAREIKLNLPLPSLIKTKCKAKRSLRIWEIILLILGSPIWLSLLVAVFSVVLSVYIVIWAVFISFWAVDLALGATALGGILLFAVTIFHSFPTALLYLGMALFSAGAFIPLFAICRRSTVLFVKLSVKMTKLIKKIILGREKK